MGEAFLSAKKERFDHGKDEAVKKEFKTENLLSLLPDVQTAEYRCALTSAEYKPEVGDRVIVTSLDANKVDVLLQNVIIGHVLAADAAKLIRVLSQSNIRMLAATVRSVGKLTPTFTISVEMAAE
jgi:hypothetical protein